MAGFPRRGVRRCRSPMISSPRDPNRSRSRKDPQTGRKASPASQKAQQPFPAVWHANGRQSTPCNLPIPADPMPAQPRQASSKPMGPDHKHRGQRDLMLTHWSRRGTHGGELEGTAPTGKSVYVDGQLLSRIVDGEFVEEWVHWDTLGLLRQIGAVPPPPP